MSPEIVALLVLAGGAVAAVAFTLIVVVTVDRTGGNDRHPPGAGEREGEER